jgi:hypothetical protein
MRFVCVLGVLALAACGPVSGPGTARQRADAAADVPENHPHPPPRPVTIPGSLTQLYCWQDGPNTICKNNPNE